MTVLLQSNSDANGQRDRYDILTAAPAYTLESRNQQLSIRGTPPLHEQTRLSAPHDSLDSFNSHLSALLAATVDYSECHALEIPFCGGFIGYCSYDLAREYIHVPTTAQVDIDIPAMQFSFFGWACIQDHQRQKSWLVIHPLCDAMLQEQLVVLLTSPSTPLTIEASTPEQQPVPATAPVSATAPDYQLTKTQYLHDIERIHAYIQAGDCYQINIAQRVSMQTTSNGDAIYWKLRAVMPSPFCSLLPIAGTDSAIISFSPERLLKLDRDGTVVTQPIKGTIKRGTTEREDQLLASTLLADSKNHAENIMIVDLLRNDLGKVCQTGSVQVAQLCELQTFANVHHLVSTITGTLEKSANGVDLLKACFPGGSITGAPKIRAMQIIEELEPSRRSIYCGSIAYFSADGTMDSNILIRTLLLYKKPESAIKTLFCWGGGGIVADSESETEYEESLTKIRSLLQATQKTNSLQ